MPEIPNKLYFRIGEVSKLITVEPYVLRYWESEFPDIKPSKSKSGQRLYKRRDVELLVKIKELLYDERYTINGARKRLKDWMRGDGVMTELEPGEVASTQNHVQATAMPPEQFDAFTPEPLRAVGESRHEDGLLHAGTAKTLLKIKRDLEDVLAIIRG